MGYVRKPSKSQRKDLLHRGLVSPTFVACTAQKPRLIIDYSDGNKCLEERTFRMDKLGYLASVRRVSEPTTAFSKPISAMLITI